MPLKKIILYVALAGVFLVVSFFGFNAYIYNQKQADTGYGIDHKNTAYIIDGTVIVLKDGVSEISQENSSAKITTRYFGNEVYTDLNDDGREDVLFYLTQERGGSGLFYYIVGALNDSSGYIGTQAIYIGDRIAPQNSTARENGVVAINYADRASGEDFSISPSVGKSMWVKLDSETLQFGLVEQNFPGEADPNVMTLTMKTWEWVEASYNDERVSVPKKEGVFNLTFDSNGTFSARTDCNGVGGNYSVNGEQITFSNMISTLMFCEGSQEAEYRSFFENASGYSFTSRGQLILHLKFDSGTVTFR